MSEFTRDFAAAIPDSGSDFRLANEVFQGEPFNFGPGNLSRPLTNRANNTPSHYLMACGLTEENWLKIEKILVKNEAVVGVDGEKLTAFKKLLHAEQSYGIEQRSTFVQRFLDANGLRYVPDEPLSAAKIN